MSARPWLAALGLGLGLGLSPALSAGCASKPAGPTVVEVREVREVREVDMPPPVGTGGCPDVTQEVIVYPSQEVVCARGEMKAVAVVYMPYKGRWADLRVTCGCANVGAAPAAASAPSAAAPSGGGGR